MWLMTFHAACARILRAEAERLGYTRQFTIYDQADARRLTKRCMDARRDRPQALHAGRDPQPDLRRQEPPARRRDLRRSRSARQFEEMIAEVYRLYERDLLRMNAMDFDDLLFRTVNLLELFAEVRERYAASFRHVLVDEYQDTNHAQYRLLQLLVGGGQAPARGERVQLAGTATSPSSATTRSRSTASATPTSATSSTSRRTSPTRASSSSSRTTARPRRSSLRPTP